jgi:hypothetical protein
MALTPEQCKVLGALVEPHATVPDRTLGMLVRRLAMGPREVAARLGELEASSPPLAELVADEVWAMQAWFPTKEGRRAYQESCDP